MKIQVENLGTIATGEVNLNKNILIFEGPNNSGKSYFSYLIYGLLKIRDNKAVNKSLYERYKNTFYKYFDRTNVLKKYVTEQGLSVNRFSWFKENYETYIKARNQVLYDSIIEVFASRDLQPTINITGNFQENILLKKTYEDIVQINGISYQRRVNNELFEMISAEHQNKYLHQLKQYFYDSILYSNSFGLYFFPAERSAFHLLSKEVFQERLLEQHRSNQQRHLKKETTTPRYPLAIRDYFDFISQLTKVAQHKSEYAHFALEIESQLMAGQVLITDQGDLQFKPDSQEKPLKLHLSSSLVKSLSSLVIYFRHLAHKNDLLIIDYPELNLHPNHQRMMARILAKAANQGLKLLLNTQSDYFLKELNNLILLSKGHTMTAKKEALFKELDYDETMILLPKKVGAYLFNGHTIHAIPITERGFAVETINDVNDQLNKAKNQIYQKLFE